MTNPIHFINEQWLWPVFGIAVLLLLLFIWTVWKGSFNRGFIINSAVSLLAIIALLLLFLRPTSATEVSGNALLLTQGYGIEQMDSIKKQHKKIKVINYSPGADFSNALDSIGHVTILGQGLVEFDFWQLENTLTSYSKSLIPTGIIQLKYPKEHRIGSPMSVSGLYHQPILGSRLVLQSSSGEGLDSMVFDSRKKQGFKLYVNPKTTGKFLYQLTETDSTGIVLNRNPLPVELMEKQVLRIFISNRFPSFETKYLKNFLSEEGHELVVRSQITKGRYKFEYFNTARSPVYGFLEKDLKKFDLLILDADTFLSFSKSISEGITRLVKEEGTGVFVQPNEALFRTANGIVDFGFKRDGTNKIKSFSLPKVQLQKYPYVFKSNNKIGVPIANYGYGLVLGKGRVSTTVLTNTYQLLLDGKSSAYREVWSKIVEATARPQETHGIFETYEPFAFKDMPYSFTLRTGLEKPIVHQTDNYSLPLLKDLVLKDAWQSKTYPVEKGWQSIAVHGDTNLLMNYFVMDTIHWKALIGANTILENSRFFSSSDKGEIQKRTLAEVSSWWFFAIFFCCMGYLWLIPKLKT